MAIEYRITFDSNGITVTQRTEPDTFQAETNDEVEGAALTSSFESHQKSKTKKSGSRSGGSGGDLEEPEGGPVAKPGTTGGGRAFRSMGDAPGIFIGPIIFMQPTVNPTVKVDSEDQS